MSIISPPDSPPSGDVTEIPPVPQEAVGVATQNGSSSIQTAGGNTDERRGLPSASSFQRYVTCPGSIALETQLRQAGQLPVDHGSKDADTGTRIHEILHKLASGAENPTEGYDADEVAVAEELWERAQHHIERVFGSDLSNVTFIVEQRHWLADTDGNDVTSGQFDLIAYDDAKALVLDYKTLFGDHAPAPTNRQLRFGAVVVHEHYGIRSGVIVLLQRMKAPSWATYNHTDIEDWLEEIDQVLERRHKDPFELGFVRSDECTFCACRLACPRLQYEFASIQASPLAIIASATDEQLATFLDKLEAVDPLKRAAKSEVEARIKSGRNVPGWKMEASAGRREITNASGVANLLVAQGAPLPEVLAGMKMTVGTAESIFKKATGAKGADAAKRFNDLTDGLVVKSSPEPTLKRA